MFYSTSFEWKKLPLMVFPECYNLQLYKSRKHTFFILLTISHTGLSELFDKRKLFKKGTAIKNLVLPIFKIF